MAPISFQHHVCKFPDRRRLPCVPYWKVSMRRFLVPFVLSAFPVVAAAQGRIIPRPCIQPMPSPCHPTKPCGRPVPTATCGVHLERVSNTVRGAVASWAKTLAGELAADGITVNNVLPGFTETGRIRQLISDRAAREGRSEDEVRSDMEGMVPARRFAEPHETGGVIAFLCSPAAGYVNGVSLAVDGGRMQSI